MGLPSQDIEFSNSIRLSARQWLAVGVLAAVVVVVAPTLWSRVDGFALEPDYRMPRQLGNDYWLYQRFAALASAQHDAVIVGDSVVWGEYVTRQQTLSHYLNERAGKERFANLGLDGAHPLALEGLVSHYATSVKDTCVVLQCNPLWLSRPKADLQDENAEVNHPRLVPQFAPRIPGYKEEISPRLGILVEQRFAFSQWTSHLQQAYYGTDIPAWTIQNPHDGPWEALRQGLPPSDNSLRHLAQPWYESGIKKQEFPWVDLDKSLQWAAFQRTVDVLQQRGNRLLVVVGPFNEHLLTRSNRQRYQQIKSGIAAWLQSRQVPHVVAAVLPSEQYGDASHPLAEGYAALASELLENPVFRSTLAKGP